MSIRQVLISTLVFAVLPQAVLLGASSTVEYVGGTVKVIPANSVGSFNFDDAKEMRFNYGSAMFKIPYEQITTTDISKAEGHHLLGKIPVPSFSSGRRKQTLSISYKDAAGAAGTLNFVLSANQASVARQTITDRKTLPQNTSASQSMEWWGDKYWKTSRNKGVWEGGNAQNAPAAGTK